MSGNKAGFYRIPTKSELEYAKKPRGNTENTGVLTVDVVYKTMANLAKSNPNFFNLSTTMALNEVKKALEEKGWKNIDVSGNSITGPEGSNGKITFYVKKARNNNGFVLRNKAGN